MTIRKMGSGVVLAAAAVVAFGLGCSGGGEKSATPNEALTGDPSQEVARVDGEVITLGDVNRIVQAWQTGRFPQIDPSTPVPEMQKQAVDELIGQRLLYEQAVKAGTVPAEEEVRAGIEQMKTRFPDPSAFQTALQQQGITEDELMQNLRMDQGIRRYVQQTIQDTINVTPDQARAYYDANPAEFQRPAQVHGEHILIRVAADAPPESVAVARARIEKIEKRIRGGGDFAAIAREESEDPGSAQRGGDLGFFSRGQMVAPFDSVAFGLEPGQMSDPVRTQFGFHLIKIEEQRPAGTLTYEEVEPRLMQRMVGLRTSDRLDSLVADLKEDATIKRKI